MIQLFKPFALLSFLVSFPMTRKISHSIFKLHSESGSFPALPLPPPSPSQHLLCANSEILSQPYAPSLSSSNVVTVMCPSLFFPPFSPSFPFSLPPSIYVFIGGWNSSLLCFKHNSDHVFLYSNPCSSHRANSRSFPKHASHHPCSPDTLDSYRVQTDGSRTLWGFAFQS